MSASTFRAHCAKGHDRIEFQGEDGAKAFEAHMKGEHKARKLYAGGPGQFFWQGGHGSAPGWKAGEIERPYPWVAPKQQRGGLERIMADAEAGRYDVTFLFAGGTHREKLASLLSAELAS